MGQSVSFGHSLGEETTLADIEVKALETAVSQAHNGEHLADIALGLMFGSFSRRNSVQDRKPDEALRLFFQPRQIIRQSHFLGKFHLQTENVHFWLAMVY